MTKEQQKAYNDLIQATDMIKKIIVGCKSITHDLELPSLVVDKLIEAKEALFQAQRDIESNLIGK